MIKFEVWNFYLGKLYKRTHYLSHYQPVHTILDIAEEFLKEFTIAYNTAYGVEYTKTTLKEIDAESFAEEKPAFQLLQRSVSNKKT